VNDRHRQTHYRSAVPAPAFQSFHVPRPDLSQFDRFLPSGDLDHVPEPTLIIEEQLEAVCGCRRCMRSLKSWPAKATQANQTYEGLSAATDRVGSRCPLGERDQSPYQAGVVPDREGLRPRSTSASAGVPPKQKAAGAGPRRVDRAESSICA